MYNYVYNFNWRKSLHFCQAQYERQLQYLVKFEWNIEKIVFQTSLS